MIFVLGGEKAWIVNFKLSFESVRVLFPLVPGPYSLNEQENVYKHSGNLFVDTRGVLGAGDAVSVLRTSDQNQHLMYRNVLTSERMSVSKVATRLPKSCFHFEKT